MFLLNGFPQQQPRPGNRRAQKAKAIGEGAERESWSDAGGRWHREGVLRRRVGYE
eukprot:COSAG04_NODE_153_length_22436_cov_37.366029_18_plen_55_part_00